MTPEAHWAMIAAIGTWAAVIVAAVAAGFIVWQIRQARALAEEQARPYVIAWVELDAETRTTLEFHVKNIGQTAARNVHISLDPPWEWNKPAKQMRFMDAAIFQRGLPTMPPGWQVTLAMEFTQDIPDSDALAPITATVTYEDRHAATHSEAFVLDLAYLRGALWLDKHGLHHIAKTLRAMAKKSGVNSF
ncbi:hypothetical protein [uncultured Microbacterium sp.]|uniref:hypothetical protein n=1 Tax=uncultured Microbacterium sp. TaxID=191216 RepID=UPI0028E482BB|nr:hypothetical protein [uncultured Microbacterium sp.]